MLLRYNPHSTRNGAASCSETCILLVEPDDRLAKELQHHLAGRFPNVASTVCGTLASARAYLSGNAVDLVLTTEELPDGSGLELLDLRAALGLTSYFFVRTKRNGKASHAALSAGATACFSLTPTHESLNAVTSEMSRVLGIADAEDRPVDDESHPQLSAEEAIGMLEKLCAETGAVAHAINNPLTVIAGNAQFVLEVARMEGTDSAVLGPIEDINTAAHQLSDALARLSALRERISALLGTRDGIDEA